MLRPSPVPALALALGVGLVACCTTRPAPEGSPAASTTPPPAVVAPPAAPTPKPPPEPTGPPAVAELSPYFTAPELAQALRDFDAGRNHPAARVFEAHAEAHPSEASGRAARFMALLARHDGGVFDPTAEQLEALATSWPVMADYARFYAGSAHLHAGRHGQARAQLAAVPRSSTLWPRAVELEAEAIDAQGDRAAAIKRVEEALDAEPDARPALWERLATLRAAAEDDAGRLDALRELATRHAGRDAGRRAASTLGDDPAYTPVQWLRLAQYRFSKHRHDQALDALEHVRKGFTKGSPEHCDAVRMTARTWEKKKQYAKAWTWYERGLVCKGRVLADATFAGGRNRLGAGALDRAEELLGRHIAAFPTRSTADDAALLLAEVHRKRGADAKADAQLLDTLRRWPDGDMVDDTAWALLWPRLDAKRWKDAVAMADRVLERVPRERHYRAEGRTLYWKGRALAHLGRHEEARAAWRMVVDAYPLSWYMLMAYSRLAQHDPATADSALKSALESARPPDNPLERVPDSLWADPHFRRGVELARMGLVDSARRELSAVTGSPEGEAGRLAFVWTRVALYSMASAPSRAVWLARREEPNFGAHWPVGHHRTLWELAHPRPFSELVERFAGERSIDPHWVYSIAREESGFDPDIESWANAIGLMQIILPTAEFLARGTDIDPTPSRLREPAVALELGSKYLAKLLARHPLIPLASAGYNAGGGAISKWRRAMGDLELDEFVERIPYREARGYAKRVTRSVARYQWLYGGERVFELSLDPPGKP